MIGGNLDILGYVFIALLGLLFFLREKYGRKKTETDLKNSIKKKQVEPYTLHPLIKTELCFGCAACVMECPEEGVMGLLSGKAILVKPNKCVGHGVCKDICPNEAIELVIGTKNLPIEIPNLTPHFETNVDGLYIVGELGGMGLIRNAVKQGMLAIEHAKAQLKSRNIDFVTDHDVVIVGAGPSGFSATLACKKEELNYLCLEQEEFGGAIRHYPRQKIVMSFPLEFPIVGKMTFRKNIVEKEEILERWNQVREKENLNILENHRFDSLEKKGNHFIIHTPNKSYTTKVAVIAMGVGGTPRKLGVEGENLEKISYRLIDAKNYTNQNIAVVGGGNSAAEAAASLSQPELGNKVVLVCRKDNLNKCNETNIDIASRKSKAGDLEIKYESIVESIDEDTITLNCDGTIEKIENHFIFVFAGSEKPFPFLRSLGVEIEKMYGTPLKEKSDVAV